MLSTSTFSRDERALLSTCTFSRDERTLGRRIRELVFPIASLFDSQSLPPLKMTTGRNTERGRSSGIEEELEVFEEVKEERRAMYYWQES